MGLALVQALLRRTATFEDMLDCALAIARGRIIHSGLWSGPMLVAAFHGRHTEGQTLPPAQRAFVTALVENDLCWPASRVHPVVAELHPDFEPGPLSRMELAFLEYIADSDVDVTDSANPIIWLRRAGLPIARDDLRTLLGP